MLEDLNRPRQAETKQDPPELAATLFRIAERRAQKMDFLLDGKNSFGDGFNGLKIVRVPYRQAGAIDFLPWSEGADTSTTVIYNVKEVAGGDTLINYQLYNPPLGPRLEDKLYADDLWENGKFKGVGSNGIGEYLESLVDQALSKK